MYRPTCRSPVSEDGNSIGRLQVRPSSGEKMTKELNWRLFSRSSTAISRPSGERIKPGSQRCASGCRAITSGSDQVRPSSSEIVL